MYNVFRPDKRGGGGVLYIRKDLNNIRIEKFSCVKEHLFENLSMEVIVKGGKTIVFTCIYRTPGSEFELFIDHIENVLKQINTSKSIYL